MSGPRRLAEIEGTIGDPARAVMLCVLLGWVRPLHGTSAAAIAPATARGFDKQFGVTV